MILTERAKLASLISAVSLVIGFAAGVWWATPTTFTIPATVAKSATVDPAECRTEFVAAPKNRINVDGITAESDQPITIEMEWLGDGRVFDGSGRAVSPGLTTNAAEVAAGMDLKSGTPTVPLPPGSTPGNAATEGGGGIDLSAMSGGTGWLLVGLGAIVFLCGPVGFIFGKKIGVGLSATEAGIISLAGVGLIGMGMYPDLAPMLVIGLAGLAAAYGVFYVLKSQRVGKVSARALAAARLVKAIDDADTGDGSAGDVVKKAVSASVGKGTELEKIIDGIIAEAGA